MQHYLHQQYETTRQGLLKEIAQLDPKVVDIQPDGFNNTIHWHIGHILAITEQLVFGFPDQSTHLPENYTTLFGGGTKPADWGSDVPSVDTLSEQLNEQLERIKQLPASSFDNALETPVLGQETFGALVGMAAFHEANHLGQIHAMQIAAKATLN